MLSWLSTCYISYYTPTLVMLHSTQQQFCFTRNAKVLDELEDPSDLNVNAGGKIIEYHGCDFFPERFFQLVVVLSTDNTILWDRLAAR